MRAASQAVLVGQFLGAQFDIGAQPAQRGCGDRGAGLEPGPFAQQRPRGDHQVPGFGPQPPRRGERVDVALQRADGHRVGGLGGAVEFAGPVGEAVLAEQEVVLGGLADPQRTGDAAHSLAVGAGLVGTRPSRWAAACST